MCVAVVQFVPPEDDSDGGGSLQTSTNKLTQNDLPVVETAATIAATLSSTLSLFLWCESLLPDTTTAN